MSPLKNMHNNKIYQESIVRDKYNKLTPPLCSLIIRLLPYCTEVVLIYGRVIICDLNMD